MVQQGVGILRVQFDDRGGTCLVVNSTATVVDNPDVSGPSDFSPIIKRPEGCQNEVRLTNIPRWNTAQSCCSTVRGRELAVCVLFG